jgi:extracellular factor (EF) 3-hydroxypalmitic acid methyl ester biosynthesis protein
MGAEPIWADNHALESLKVAATAFEALDNGALRADLGQAVAAAVRRLCGAITACEEARIDKREILAHLGKARAIHGRSPFIARAQEWPRGYEGDFETIEYLCDAVNHAPLGTIEHELEDLALKSPIACQHRNKVAFQADAMVSACRRKHGRARVLSIGCGGCRDIRSVANELQQAQAEFVLCDHDYEALDFALHSLGPLAERCTYLDATIPRVLRKLLRHGPFDLTVAGGLFDYLPDRWVTLSIRIIWHTLLAPDGVLVFTNIKKGNPFRVWLEYLGNWDLNERDKSEVIQFCTEGGIPQSAVQVQEDATGLALLVKCQRPT